MRFLNYERVSARSKKYLYLPLFSLIYSVIIVLFFCSCLSERIERQCNEIKRGMNGHSCSVYEVVLVFDGPEYLMWITTFEIITEFFYLTSKHVLSNIARLLLIVRTYKVVRRLARWPGFVARNGLAAGLCPINAHYVRGLVHRSCNGRIF